MTSGELRSWKLLCGDCLTSFRVPAGFRFAKGGFREYFESCEQCGNQAVCQVTIYPAVRPSESTKQRFGGGLYPELGRTLSRDKFEAFQSEYEALPFGRSSRRQYLGWVMRQVRSGCVVVV